MGCDLAATLCLPELKACGSAIALWRGLGGSDGVAGEYGASGVEAANDFSGDGLKGEHVMEDPELGASAGHSVDGAGPFIFAEGVAARAEDGRHTVLSVATHAGEDNAHSFLAELVGCGEHQYIHGRNVRGVGWHQGHVCESAGTATKHAKLSSGAANVNDAGTKRFVGFGLFDPKLAEGIQTPREGAGETRGHMLDD